MVWVQFSLRYNINYKLSNGSLPSLYCESTFLTRMSQNATLDATLSTVQEASRNLTSDSLGWNRYHNVPALTVPMGTAKVKDCTQVCSVPETAPCKGGETC